MRRHEIIPGVRFKVFDRQRHASVLRIQGSNDGLDLLTFLQHLARMLDATRPRNIRNVNQTIDAVFDLDKRAKVSKIADAPMYSAADLITFSDGPPGILLDLLHAQTDPVRPGIDAEDFHFDGIAGPDQL